MVYPIFVFGYALLLEERPGKLFWYTMLIYTQLLMILNFAVMLTLWNKILTPD